VEPVTSAFRPLRARFEPVENALLHACACLDTDLIMLYLLEKHSPQISSDDVIFEVSFAIQVTPKML
jgi:hypothetical protein